MSDIGVKAGIQHVLKPIDVAYEQRPKDLKGNKPLLVAVSKTKPVEMIIDAYTAGNVTSVKITYKNWWKKVITRIYWLNVRILNGILFGICKVIDLIRLLKISHWFE